MTHLTAAKAMVLLEASCIGFGVMGAFAGAMGTGWKAALLVVVNVVAAGVSCWAAWQMLDNLVFDAKVQALDDVTEAFRERRLREMRP